MTLCALLCVLVPTIVAGVKPGVAPAHRELAANAFDLFEPCAARGSDVVHDLSVAPFDLESEITVLGDNDGISHMGASRLWPHIKILGRARQHAEGKWAVLFVVFLVCGETSSVW